MAAVMFTRWPSEKKVLLFISTLQSRAQPRVCSSLQLPQCRLEAGCHCQAFPAASAANSNFPPSLYSAVLGALLTAIEIHTFSRLLFTWTWSDESWSRAAGDETPSLRRCKPILKVVSFVVVTIKKGEGAVWVVGLYKCFGSAFFSCPTHHFISAVAHQSGFANRDSLDSWRQSPSLTCPWSNAPRRELIYFRRLSGRTGRQWDRRGDISASAGRCILGTVRWDGESLRKTSDQWPPPPTPLPHSPPSGS